MDQAPDLDALITDLRNLSERNGVRATLTAFAAALLTDVAVEAGARANWQASRDDDPWDAIGEDVREMARAEWVAGLRAAIRAAGVEPPSPTDRAAGCAEAVENGYQDEQRTARRQRARADQARAEADALRAEVAALRGLGTNRGEIVGILVRIGKVADASNVGAMGHALRVALATVPPAKVADAVQICPIGRMSDPPRWCALVAGHHGPCSFTRAASKPEPAGLEPLGPPTVPGFPPMHYRGLVARINELSAIAKRGGS